MNRLLLASGFAALLWGNLALAAYRDEVLADNPVAYYRFEETSGTTFCSINQALRDSAEPRDLMVSTIS
jgi:hypothetical protein